MCSIGYGFEAKSGSMGLFKRINVINTSEKPYAMNRELLPVVGLNSHSFEPASIFSVRKQRDTDGVFWICQLARLFREPLQWSKSPTVHLIGYRDLSLMPHFTELLRQFLMGDIGPFQLGLDKRPDPLDQFAFCLGNVQATSSARSAAKARRPRPQRLFRRLCEAGKPP
jgi:hypothetical protein